jgi:transcriptional regulator with GAF, ATPase, and Fis domain
VTFAAGNGYGRQFWYVFLVQRRITGILSSTVFHVRFTWLSFFASTLGESKTPRKLVQQMTAPKRQLSDVGDQRTVGIILTAIEQIRLTMGAGGAILAMRDAGGLRWLASAGHVPATGSDLQLASEFTRECLETGRVVLCQDAHDDSRIRVGAARILRLRAAIAVPIHFRGSLIGIIELFSPFPGTFDGNHVATLQEIGELLAPVLASESARILRSASSNLTLDQIQTVPLEEVSSEEAEVLEFDAPSSDPLLLEQLVSRLSLEPGVTRKR